MGQAAENHANHDFFPTPKALCMAAIFECIPFGFNPYNILDAGAGSGVWGEVARKRWPQAHIAGVEFRNEPQPDAYSSWYNADFLNINIEHTEGNFDLVGFNLPYGVNTQGKTDKRYLEKGIRHCLNLLRLGGVGLFLTRLSFLSGGARMRDFWRRYPLRYTYILGDRPSFTGDGRTEGKTDYTILVFNKGFTGESTIRWLDWKRYEYTTAKAHPAFQAQTEQSSGISR